MHQSATDSDFAQVQERADAEPPHGSRGNTLNEAFFGRERREETDQPCTFSACQLAYV